MTWDPFDRSHGEVERLGERSRVSIAALAVVLLMGGVLLAVPSPFRESVSDAPSEGEPGAEVGEAASPRLFHSSTASGGVSLGIDDAARADGFLHGTNLAPGDTVVGELLLDASPKLSASQFALSFSIEGPVDAPAGHPRLVDSLHVTSLTYAGEQLVRGPSRDILREIDGDPSRGNADGALSLAELAPGVFGLAPPLPSAEGGSRLNVTVLFDPSVTGDGTAYAGQRLNLTFVFGLTDLRTPPTPPSAPGAPGALNAASVTVGAVTLSWSPPANTGGLPITGYHVYRGQSPLSEIAFVQGLSYTSGGLAAGIYHFAVSASTAAGTGPMSNVIEVRVPAAPPTSNVTIAPTSPDGANGWYLTAPTLTFAAQPAGATVLVGLDEAAPIPATGLTVPPGEHLITYFARAGGLDEAPHTLAVKRDDAAPSLTDIRLSGVPLEPGGAVTVTALVEDADAGIASVSAIVAPAGGAPQERPLTLFEGRYHATFTPEGAGDHALAIVARDHAGRTTRVDVGALEARAPGVVDPANETTGAPLPTGTDGGATGPATGGGASGGGATNPTSGGDPLERTGTSAGSAPGATTDTGGPAVLVLRPDNSSVDPRNGLDGVVTIRLENGKDTSRTLIYVVSPNGTVTLLGEGGEARWDTDDWPDGFYTIETRERHDDGTETTVASTTVLVRHPKTTAVVAGVAVAAGVGIAVGAGGGFGAAGSALASRFASLWTIAEKYLAGIGEDKFRERTKRFAILAGRSGSHMNPWAAAFIASTILAAFFTLGAIAGWSFWDFVAQLPIIGGATIAFYATVYLGETLLTRRTGAKAEFRFLVSGMIALALSTIVLRNPFGYAGYIEKDEIGDDAALPQRRLAAVRVLAIFGIILATILPFLLVGYLWRYDIADWGIFIAMTALATSSMPLKPLNGSEIWVWSRPLAIVGTIVAFVLYFMYVLAVLPMLFLVVLSALGLVTYIIAWWRLQRVAATLVDTGVDHAGPTR